MFGQQNNNDNQQIPDHAIDNVMQDTAQDTTPHNNPPLPPAPHNDGNNDGNTDWQHPGTPLDPAHADVVAPTAPLPLPAHDSVQDHHSNYSANDLIDIKQQALQQLTPLVGHLEQSPEEKFRTTMMMIQASDDQTLVKDAYEAANKIEDEKVRAQALLDIVNEINYFTSHHPEA